MKQVWKIFELTEISVENLFEVNEICITVRVEFDREFSTEIEAIYFLNEMAMIDCMRNFEIVKVFKPKAV